jgi:S1-C subfamily serine protease
MAAVRDKSAAADWKQVIAASRAFLSYCQDMMDSTIEATYLGSLAKGLVNDQQFADSLPIGRRCVVIKPDETACYLYIGQALEGMDRTKEAIEAYQKAISVGGYDGLSAAAVDLARQRWIILRQQLADENPPREREQPPKQSGPTIIAGTGFFVSSLGHIVTNKHVVDGCHTITTRDGQSLTLVLLSGTADLALLKQDKHPSASATFRNGSGIRVGDEVIAFGFPLPGILSSEGNISTGTVAANSGLGDDPHFIQVSAPVQPGNSGGPLFDTSGNVVGIVVAKLDAIQVANITGDIPENVNFSISRDVVVDFLKSSSVPFQQKPSLGKLKTSDVAVLAKNISVAITCVK